MARIRYIKPTIGTDEDLANVSIPARYLFAILPTLCDREGRMEDSARVIKLNTFPWDEIDVESLLLELARHQIVRYSVGGKRYLQMIGFKKHQRPHHAEVPSEIPAFTTRNAKKPVKDVPKPVLLGLGEYQTAIKGTGMGMGMGMGTCIAPSAHEPKIVKPKTPTQRIVEAYKLSKNVPMDDKAWDKANFGRYSKAAVNILACFGQDVEKCAAYIFLRAEDLNEKRLDWTLETITRHAFDGIGIPKKEDENGHEIIPMVANRLSKPGRTGGTTASRSLAGDALRAIKLSALHPNGSRDMDGPATNQSRDDEDFS